MTPPDHVQAVPELGRWGDDEAGHPQPDHPGESPSRRAPGARWPVGSIGALTRAAKLSADPGSAVVV
jgi:hypothetical protein